MNYLTLFYPESNFGGFPDIDGNIIFYTRVNSLINQSSILIDIGCGVGSYAKDKIPIRRDLRIFKGKCRKVIGIDVVQYANKNPFIDEFDLIENEYWPIADETIDVAICDSVLEHVEKPELFFSECQRVIKPGGYLCIKTANALGYVGLVSRIIPNRFHVNVLKISQFDRKENDIFPTYHRCNTVRKFAEISR